MLCQYRWDFSEFMPHGVFANALDAEALPLVAPVDFRMPFTACRVQSATVESKHREAGGEGVGGHKEEPHTPDFHAGANVIVGRVRVHGRLLLPRSRRGRAPGYRQRRPRPGGHRADTQTTTHMHAHSPQPHPSDAHCSLEARCQRRAKRAQLVFFRRQGAHEHLDESEHHQQVPSALAGRCGPERHQQVPSALAGRWASAPRTRTVPSGTYFLPPGPA